MQIREFVFILKPPLRNEKIKRNISAENEATAVRSSLEAGTARRRNVRNLRTFRSEIEPAGGARL
jgi:hypothetical protein